MDRRAVDVVQRTDTCRLEVCRRDVQVPFYQTGHRGAVTSVTGLKWRSVQSGVIVKSLSQSLLWHWSPALSVFTTTAELLWFLHTHIRTVKRLISDLQTGVYKSIIITFKLYVMNSLFSVSNITYSRSRCPPSVCPSFVSFFHFLSPPPLPHLSGLTLSLSPSCLLRITVVIYGLTGDLSGSVDPLHVFLTVFHPC